MQGSIERRACQASAIFLLIAFLGLPASGKELTKPLTAAEVACNERQLERLLQRMNAAKEVYITPQLSTSLLVSPGDSAGAYHGLAATFQSFRLSPGELPPVNEYEHYLAFNVSSSKRALLLNPDRHPLPQINLNRETSNSNLVQPGSYFELILTLDPTMSGGEPLVINNFKEPRFGDSYNGFLANSTKVGRGLLADGLLKPCHDKLTDFDRHVFDVLQRVVRSEGMDDFFRPDIETAIFRGEDPHTYRLNFYPIYEGLEERGRMAVEVRLAWTNSGKLTTGRVRLFPACAFAGQLGCTTLRGSSLAFFLIPPVFGGREFFSWDALERGGFFIWYEGPSEPRTINLERVLTGTTWNEPVW